MYYGNQRNCRNDLVSSLGFPGDSELEVNCQRSYGLCEAQPEPALTSLHITMKNKIICIFSLFLHGHGYSKYAARHSIPAWMYLMFPGFLENHVQKLFSFQKTDDCSYCSPCSLWRWGSCLIQQPPEGKPCFALCTARFACVFGPDDSNPFV